MRISENFSFQACRHFYALVNVRLESHSLAVYNRNTMKYNRLEAGDWVTPIENGYKFACCDCGLIYKMDFAIVVKPNPFWIISHQPITSNFPIIN